MLRARSTKKGLNCGGDRYASVEARHPPPAQVWRWGRPKMKQETGRTRDRQRPARNQDAEAQLDKEPPMEASHPVRHAQMCLERETRALGKRLCLRLGQDVQKSGAENPELDKKAIEPPQAAGAWRQDTLANRVSGDMRADKAGDSGGEGGPGRVVRKPRRTASSTWLTVSGFTGVGLVSVFPGRVMLTSMSQGPFLVVHTLSSQDGSQ